MRTVLAVLIVAASVVAPPAAQATTGSITTATANSDWTQGHVVGSITVSDCSSPDCTWLPLLTVQPSLPEYNCRGDELTDTDPNTQPYWFGAQQMANGTVPFDQAAGILRGVYGQRACLLIRVTRKYPDPACITIAQYLGNDPVTACPPEAHTFFAPVTSAILTVPAAPAPDPQPAAQGDPPPPADPGAPPPPTALTAAFAKRTATTALAKRYAVKWKKGHHRKVSCHRLAAQTFECPTSFRYKRQRFAGRVVVSGTQEMPSTRVLVASHRS
jgi:hypothetical protein